MTKKKAEFATTAGEWTACTASKSLFPHVHIGPYATCANPHKWVDQNYGPQESLSYLTINEGPDPDWPNQDQSGTSMRTCKANAKLIAASPNLRDAALQVIDWYYKDSSEFNRDLAIDAIKKALLKAGVPYKRLKV